MTIHQQILDKLSVSEAQLLEMLEQDVREIFVSTVGMDIDSCRISEASGNQFGGSVSAMVGMAGAYSGLICLLVPLKLAAAITGSMLGDEVDEHSPDVSDAMGELANMTAGSFKHHFIVDGHEVKLSTPSVVSGENYSMSVAPLADMAALEFEVAGSVLRVSVFLELD